MLIMCVWLYYPDTWQWSTVGRNQPSCEAFVTGTGRSCAPWYWAAVGGAEWQAALLPRTLHRHCMHLWGSSLNLVLFCGLNIFWCVCSVTTLNLYISVRAWKAFGVQIRASALVCSTRKLVYTHQHCSAKQTNTWKWEADWETHFEPTFCPNQNVYVNLKPNRWVLTRQNEDAALTVLPEIWSLSII